jgi:uncharacterized protein
MKHFPIALIIALCVQITCQLFKVIYYSIRQKKLSLHYFTSAGGFPSSHTAFVTALTTAIGIRNGVHSDIFAVSAVFTAIIAYDAYRLRGHVQDAAKTINRLMAEHFPEEKDRLSEMVGHSISEIAAGILFGGTAAGLITILVSG